MSGDLAPVKLFISSKKIINMKNLSNPVVKEEIFSRINKITPDAKAHWGKMNVNQNHRHLSMSFDIPTGKLDPTPGKFPPIPKWLFKFFLLNTKPPKARAETFKEIDVVKNGINPTDFEAERNNLKNAIETFTKSTSLIPENKIAGKFSKDDW